VINSLSEELQKIVILFDVETSGIQVLDKDRDIKEFEKSKKRIKAKLPKNIYQ